MREFMFCCPTCAADLVFEGDMQQATSDCMTCGTVWVCPADLMDSEEDEQQIDRIMDERFER